MSLAVAFFGVLTATDLFRRVYANVGRARDAWLTAMSRPAASGLRPSAEQVDSVRETLTHTLRGLEMMAPLPPQATAAP